MRPADGRTARPGVDLRRSDRLDRRRWILAVSVGEGVGFALATALAVLGLVAGIDGPGRLALAMVGGAMEGAALASGQYLGMRTGRPAARRWIGATALAAALAWALGMMPSTLGTDLGEPAALLALVAGGIVLLASIPVAQWLVLARPGTFRWVPVNAGAWLVAILWTFAPSPFIDERSPVVVVATLYVLAGVLMAVTSHRSPRASRVRSSFPARRTRSAGEPAETPLTDQCPIRGRWSRSCGPLVSAVGTGPLVSW
ncbi:hypothetical protein [Promicromonospora sp. NPDC060271]|uniref:hypothetical protein n=1 Tax=Promicromonospora sp. NPDC060271 TaxID=3347089 RepID=UPI00365BC86C